MNWARRQKETGCQRTRWKGRKGGDATNLLSSLVEPNDLAALSKKRFGSDGVDRFGGLEELDEIAAREEERREVRLCDDEKKRGRKRQRTGSRAQLGS